MSMLDSYVYHVDLDWEHKRSGKLRIQGIPSIAISAPQEFSGDPGRWTPEHLLTAATASCFMTTFMAIAEIQKLEVHSFKMIAFGRLEKVPGEGYRFTEMTLSPEISVATEDIEKALRVIEKAERNCFISNSLKAKVQVEPRFVSALVEQAV